MEATAHLSAPACWQTAAECVTRHEVMKGDSSTSKIDYLSVLSHGFSVTPDVNKTNFVNKDEC